MRSRVFNCHCARCAAQVRYPAAEATLPTGLSGRHFRALFGSQQSTLEALMLKRRIKGPSWMMLKNPLRKEPGQQVGCHAAVCSLPPLTDE